MKESKEPILYVMVIGFHHKKGCQVEFSFPPLPGNQNECPLGWKYLPTLALPDGSHNYENDTVFFHLPSLEEKKSTVYGISCFRQIPIEKIKNRTSDITRGTVQKSVCVLSRIPLYGKIQVKMSLITHAYFEEGDFSKVSILEDTYHHLNDILLENDTGQQLFIGLSASDFILQWKHKAVLLFKLLLLEKRVLFFKSPVLPLCSSLLTLCSLFPDMIDKGLSQSASIRLSRPMSPMPQFSDDDSPNLTPTKENFTFNSSQEPVKLNENGNNRTGNIEMCQNEIDIVQNGLDVTTNLKNGCQGICQIENGVELTEASGLEKDVKDNSIGEKSNSLKREVSVDAISDNMHSLTYLAQIPNESCGFPLGAFVFEIFTKTAFEANITRSLLGVQIRHESIFLAVFAKGSLCLPYLSLSYLDILTDVNVRSYVVGATNVLFKQKRQLWDILVDIDNNRIECQDPVLRKHLHLTTEDLRFADYIVKHVSEEKHDVFLDGVGWEGGDEWIRAQFKIYMLCLMRTSLLQDGAREIESFNSSFLTAWRETHNYKMWLSGINPGILSFHQGHPFAGQLSVADLRVRLAHTMQNTDSGRKINQAMTSTGRAVATTSKAVGGALYHAKGALSSWWSTLMVTPETKNVDDVSAENPGNLLSENVLCETEDISVSEIGNVDIEKNSIIKSIKNFPENTNTSKTFEKKELKRDNDNTNLKENINDFNMDHQPGEVYTV